jgi:hypothetical protein
MLCRDFINLLLRRVHVVHVVETVSVPHRKVRVQLNIFGSFPVIDLTSEILHASDGPVTRIDLHDREKEIALFLAG